MSWRIDPFPEGGPLFEGAIAVYAEAFAPPPYSDPDRGEEIRYRLRRQWWRDAVARELDWKARRRWLGNAYELVEIAVHPDFQSRGIGAVLVEALLEGRPEKTCVLSTRTDSRAHELYGRLGFEVITEMTFTPGGAPFYVMGKVLG